MFRLKRLSCDLARLARQLSCNCNGAVAFSPCQHKTRRGKPNFFNCEQSGLPAGEIASCRYQEAAAELLLPNVRPVMLTMLLIVIAPSHSKSIYSAHSLTHGPGTPLWSVPLMQHYGCAQWMCTIDAHNGCTQIRYKGDVICQGGGVRQGTLRHGLRFIDLDLPNHSDYSVFPFYGQIRNSVMNPLAFSFTNI
ncbi:hypothetical protein F4803DRAFT_52953 [Xylaria telfairii]|nr:hypothetical protein F4803DRAFT_52953 [Xylaria telfairii]